MPSKSHNSRNYSLDQVKRIMTCQNDRNAFSTELALATGVRAHELLTLRTTGERPMENHTVYSAHLRDGVRYTVIGTGNLVREVSIPHELAHRVESRRLAVPISYVDRGTTYAVVYDLAGGLAWSTSFSQASKTAIGFSNGAHGLRHTYAQDRWHEVTLALGDLKLADLIVSQELGYLGSVIRKTYLR